MAQDPVAAWAPVLVGVNAVRDAVALLRHAREMIPGACCTIRARVRRESSHALLAEHGHLVVADVAVDGGTPRGGPLIEACKENAVRRPLGNVTIIGGNGWRPDHKGPATRATPRPTASAHPSSTRSSTAAMHNGDTRDTAVGSLAAASPAGRPASRERRILVATMIPALGAGLERWLDAAQHGWKVVGVVSDREGLRRALTPELAVVVASVCLDGVLVGADLKEMRSACSLLALADEPDAIAEADLLRAGASCVLPVRTDRDQLVRAVGDLIAGRPPTSVEALRLLSAGPGGGGPLPARQMAVLTLLARGRTSQQIARELHVTPSTVKTHVARMAARFGLSGHAELARRAPSLLAGRQPE